MILKGIKMKRSETGVTHYVRITFPDLMENDFDAYHRLVSKYRSRAKARGFDPSNLKQEEWDIIINDNLEKLEKGQKVHTSWVDTVGKGLIEDAREYLERKPNSHVIDNDDTVNQWLTIPSSIKLAARGLKQGNDYMLQSSLLPPELIERVKEQMDDWQSKAVIV